ncbi:MAG: hypothetical protein WCI73_00450 [Phycisphaerae bacterium]
MKLRSLGFIGLAGFGLMAGTALGKVQYTVTDVGTAGGISSIATDINNSGQIVGHFTSGSGQTQAFLLSGGIMSALGTLGGAGSYASAINANGQIVGMANIDSTNTSSNMHAFLYANGIMTDLTSGVAGNSWAYDINDSGQVVGEAGINASGPKAFVYQSGTMTNIGMGIAYCINAGGKVAGSDNNWNGFTYKGAGMVSLPYASNATISAINNSGVIVGGSQNLGKEQACMFYNGGFTSLGTIGNLGRMGGFSIANDVNTIGDIVGYSNYIIGDTNDNHAFLFRNSEMIDLNSVIEPSLGWTLDSANAINDVGQIVGYGLINGQTHAFLLTPVAVPEPSALFSVLVPLGICGAFGRLNVKRRLA